MALLVTVSQNAVVEAESEISNCGKCASDASTPFWQVLDSLRNSAGADVVYFLPVLANCPNCRAPIAEGTLVAPKRPIPQRRQPVLAESNA